MGNLESRIIELLEEEAEMAECEIDGELTRATVIMDSGIDSLVFATVVVVLEAELGIDPFAASDEPYYPNTVGDFIDFYEKHISDG